MLNLRGRMENKKPPSSVGLITTDGRFEKRLMSDAKYQQAGDDIDTPTQVGGDRPTIALNRGDDFDRSSVRQNTTVTLRT